MTDELSAISVGLSVNLGSLDRDLAAIEKKVGKVAGDHVINFKTGKVDVAAVREQIRKATQNAIPVPITVARGGAAAIRRELASQLAAGAPIPVKIKANLSSTEVARIKREIATALGTTPITIKVAGVTGGGSSGSAVSGVVTPHERRVNDDVAAKVGRAVRGTTGRQTARAEPQAPTPASSPTAAPPKGQRASTMRGAAEAIENDPEALRKWREEYARTQGPKTRRATEKAHETVEAAGRDAGPTPAVSRVHQRTSGRPIKPTPLDKAIAKAGFEQDFGGVPTGDAVPVTRRYDAKGNLIAGPLPKATTRTARYLRKRTEAGGGRRVSPDELKRQKTRVDAPETEDELEYAERPSQVSYHGPQEEMDYQDEKRSRGVRGARRSGARERNEPVLTDMDLLSRDIQRDDNEAENAPRRDAEVRAPARRSAAYYGSAGSRLHSAMARTQFYKMDPAFGEAFELLQKDDMAGARAALRGASARLSGADPRDRKKFFKMFRNVEKVPPELLEKDAALRSLFAEIHSRVDPSFTNVASASTMAGAGGGGPKAKPGARRNTVDKDIASLNDGTMTRAEFEVRHPHLKREGGGHVGPLQRRLNEARARDAYLVGEKKAELFEGDSGRLEIIGEHGPEIRTFPEPGRVHPYVPEWVRRGMAKDLTHREAGGPVYSGRLAAEPGSGLKGRKVYREEFDGERSAIATGKLSATGGVQRVFVVNFPPAFGRGPIAGAPSNFSVAAGPMLFGTAKEADAFADRLGGSLGKTLKSLLDVTKDVRPEPAEKEGPVRISATERFDARLESLRSVEGLRARQQKAASQGAEQVSLLPSRGLPVFGAQLVQQLSGVRSGAQGRAREAQAALQNAVKLTTLYAAETTKLSEALAKRDKAESGPSRTAATEAAREQLGITRRARTEADAATKAAETANSEIIKGPGILKNIAAATIGTIAGVTLYGAAIGAAQAGITALGQVVGPVVERLSGYQNVTAGVTSALADQTRAQDGAVKTTIAQAAAQAGLSKATLDLLAPQLESRAQAEAGNKALQEGIDLLHSSEAISRQNAGRGGVDRNVTQTTGGLFGSIVNGIPSTSELVGNTLRDVTAIGAEDRRAVLQRGQQSVLGGRDPSKLVGIELQLYSQLTAELESLGGALGDSSGRLQFFNDAIAKGGESFRFVAQSSLPGLDPATRAKAEQAALDANAVDIANNIRDLKTIIVDSSGKVVTSSEDITKTLQAINKSFTTPDPAALIRQLTERIIPASRSQFRAEGQFQRELALPSQFALNQLANPTPGIAGGPAFEEGIVGRDSQGKIDQAAADSAASYREQVGGAVEYVNSRVEEGRKALINLVPPDLRQEFSGILDDITATGKQISGIQLGLQQRQTNLALAEYNNGLRIARRSLQDAKDLQAGIAGATIDTVGGLEGANIRLGRQAQLLGFALQQRSITTDLAVAKFQAPGDTPEERFARQEEAVVKARIAQQQLDISKQIGGNQFRSLTLEGTGEVARQITDLNAQIDLLEKGRSLTYDTAAANRAIDILSKKQEDLIARAGTYLEEGGKIVQAAIQAAAEVQRQTGKGFQSILSETAEAWGIFGDQAQVILDALTGAAPTSYRTPKEQREFDKAHHAYGIVGSTAGRTDMTVGEAGTETVAVLRNPKLVDPGSLGAPSTTSGGNYQFTIQFGDVSVRDQSDIEEIADAIERRISTKLQLLGVRGPSY